MDCDSGIWGPVPMAPAPRVFGAGIVALAEWTLAGAK